MLKKFLLGAALTTSLVFSQQTALAVDLTTGLSDAAETGAGYQDQDISVVIGNIIKVVLGFLGVIFLILVIYAGITWMTAAGDAKKVDKAKGVLVTAVIGLVIVLAAYSITSFVVNQLSYATTRSAAPAAPAQ